MSMAAAGSFEIIRGQLTTPTGITHAIEKALLTVRNRAGLTTWNVAINDKTLRALRAGDQVELTLVGHLGEEWSGSAIVEIMRPIEGGVELRGTGLLILQ